MSRATALRWERAWCERGKQALQGAGRAAYTDQQPWLGLIRLAAYSPALDPVEGLWGWRKGKCVANLCPDTLEPIRHELRRGRRRLARRTDLAIGFLRRTGLS